MIIPPCILQSDFSSATMGAFTEEIKDERGINQGIVRSIEATVRERARTICKATDKVYIENELISIRDVAQEMEKSILSYFASQIEPDEIGGFFQFWVRQWRFVKSNVFQELHILYTLRHWTEEAEHLRELLSDPANEGKFYLTVTYGRNMNNKELFIQEISLKEIK